MTPPVPFATFEVPEAANVIELAELLMRQINCPSLIPAVKIMPVTAPLVVSSLLSPEVGNVIVPLLDSD
jgi:hypothetical protein